MSRVAIAACPDYRDGHVEAAVSALFDALRDDLRVQAGEKILLKPNLLSAATVDKACTTHPAVFRAVALSLAERGAILSYGDSPAIESTAKCARSSGIGAAAEALGIPAADFDTAEEVFFPEGRVLRRFPMARCVLEADAVIGLPKFKTHALAGFTGAIKNQFGCMPGKTKAGQHVRFPDPEDFSAMCVDLVRYLPPRFCIMDAVVGMEGNGPRNGIPRTIGLLMASSDPVALDAVAGALAGLSLSLVHTTRIGGETGLGESDLDRIEVVYHADPTDKETFPKTETASHILETLRIRDFKRARPGSSTMSRLTGKGAKTARRLVLDRPMIQPAICTRCRVCVEACPMEPKALTSDSPRSAPRYDHARCIRCFCCQELCPAGAIVVRKAPLGFILDR